MRSLALTQADEEQLLREKPVLRQIFDAQVWQVCVVVDLVLCVCVDAYLAIVPYKYALMSM